MKIKIISRSGNLPSYETSGSAGMDLCADLSKPVILMPGERKLIPTGLFIELPSGYEAQIRARSGLALRHGLGLVNGIGTIDSDYRGEIQVLMINWGEKPYTIHHSDRIAQMVIAKYETIEWEETDSINHTKRSSGGFGHTGK